MTSTYRELPDGSGVITETLPDGSTREIRLPPPFLVDCGPRWNSPADEEEIRRREDRITALDRSDQ